MQQITKGPRRGQGLCLSGRHVRKVAQRHRGGDGLYAFSAGGGPKFADDAIHEEDLRFSVARAFDRARGIATPRVWTARRDKEQRDKGMWAALQG